MKTDDLLAAIAADVKPSRGNPVRLQLLAMFAGGLLSLVILLTALGLRADLVAALATWRFDVKLAVAVAALLLALRDCIRLVSPLASGWASRASLLIPVLLLAAVAVELAAVPTDAWGDRLVGTNALVCLMVIPALSLAPLLLGLLAMRAGAPASPATAGAAVGRVAAAVAAALYALHCFDDSPLFIATWYPLASLPVILTGAMAGRWLLRW
jgi:hypothetical protein